MPGNFSYNKEVKFIPLSDVIHLARNYPDPDRAKHIIFTVLSFFMGLVEDFEAEQQLLWDFIGRTDGIKLSFQKSFFE